MSATRHRSDGHEEIVALDALPLSAAIRRRELSCREVMQAYLAQIERFNPRVNAIVSLPAYVRLTRAAVMTELNRDYVTASRLAGAGTLRLMFVCVLPNCMAPLIVQATLSFSSAILDAAALGFLGLGVQPPTPEWGTMLASARDYIERAWWVVSLPGLTILLSVLAINLMGDGLRDALDPKLKNAA